ncbi:MAG: cysteine dioxygenase [Actinomycetia bacterium]|nr:cysteine dioxygenase [Actinomycetes bacterium]MCH9769008.1 cysteine dioxygenase [Actinomycetes bacterium]
MADDIAPLRRFVRGMTEIVADTPQESVLLQRGRVLLAELIRDDAWLPEAYAAARSDRYAQYLLHCDPLERFSIVSFVWGSGQCTPVHNHTVWGLVGVLRGAERTEEFELRDGLPRDLEKNTVMAAEEIAAVSPTVGDWHRVTNASDDVSVSIHIYGGNVGTTRRSMLDEESGQLVDFVSGYDNSATPNLWGTTAPVPC